MLLSVTVSVFSMSRKGWRSCDGVVKEAEVDFLVGQTNFRIVSVLVKSESQFSVTRRTVAFSLSS